MGSDEKVEHKLEEAKAQLQAIAKLVKDNAPAPSDGPPDLPEKVPLVEQLFNLVPQAQYEAAFAVANGLSDADLLECLRGLNPGKNSSISVYFSHVYWRELFVRAKKVLDAERSKKEESP